MKNTVLNEILRSDSVQDKDGAIYPLQSQIPEQDGQFIQQLIEQYKPKKSLEIGLAYGISALYICEALAKVGGDEHVVIDPLQYGASKYLNLSYASSDERWDAYNWSVKTGWRGIGMLNLQRAGFGGLVKHLGEPGHLALPKLVEANEKFDFAFIDGWHTFDYVLIDFFYADLLLKPGGILVFDDSKDIAIRKFLRYVLTNRSYEVVDLQREGLVSSAPSLKRATMQRLAKRFPKLKGWVTPEVLCSDAQLGLPDRRCIALRKLSDDVLGDGHGDTRSWNHHHEF